MIEIPLSGRYSDRVALIDDEDAPKVIGRSWYGQPNAYGETIYARSDYQFLHHVVLGINPDALRPVEHLDQNGLNCQKSNLLISTHSHNKLNRLGKAQRNRLDSKHCGVGFDPRSGRWFGKIGAAHFWYSLGSYATETEAAAKVTEVRGQLLATPFDLWEPFMAQYKRHGGRERLSKDELEHKYIEQRMSLKQIADEYGTTAPTINRWLREHGIPVRTPAEPPAKLSREALDQKYTVECMSMNQIAREVGVTRPAIAYWLRSYGIPLRAPGKRTYQATY